MELVREIEVGMDMDGDAVPDLKPPRIYYLGPTAGATQGAILLAVEPSVRLGVLSVVETTGPLFIVDAACCVTRPLDLSQQSVFIWLWL